MMTLHLKNDPASALTLGGVYADACGKRLDRTQTETRPQLRRLGDTSKSVAFVDAADGTMLGWISRSVNGWHAARVGYANAWVFSSALRAVRFVCGGSK